jgi:hypothetical protein
MTATGLCSGSAAPVLCWRVYAGVWPSHSPTCLFDGAGTSPRVRATCCRTAVYSVSRPASTRRLYWTSVKSSRCAFVSGGAIFVQTHRFSLLRSGRALGWEWTTLDHRSVHWTTSAAGGGPDRKCAESPETHIARVRSTIGGGRLRSGPVDHPAAHLFGRRLDRPSAAHRALAGSSGGDRCCWGCVKILT